MNKNNVNYKAFQYASDKQSLIEMLCSDLFSNTKIKSFGYLRFLKNGRYLYLGTRLDFIAFYMQNVHNTQIELGNRINYTLLNQNHYSLWPTVQSDYFMEALYNHNMWNGFCIFKRREQYIEAWAFASDRNFDSLSDYYCKHLELMKSFIDDFSIFLEQIFLKESKDNLAIMKDYEVGKDYHIGEEEITINYKINKERIDQFMKLTEPKRKIAIVTDRGEEYLTKSELFCMNKLMKGLNTKEIAKLIPRSYRTIEKHIENIKKKLECRSIYNLKNTYRLGKILPFNDG